ncbi:MAG: hypothetical protein ACT4OZ_07515 [Gemmatimonadota bacterium]
MSPRTGIAEAFGALGLLCALLLPVPLACQGAAAGPQSVRLVPGSPAEDFARVASDTPFRLTGTIASRGTVTTSAVSASRMMATVTVDSILRKPASVRLARGRRITVILADTTDAVSGSQYTFLASAVIIDTSLVLRARAHVPLSTSQSVDTVAYKLAAADSINLSTAILARGRNALVVDATIDSVKPVPLTNQAARMEHTAGWRQAYLRVHEWIAPRELPTRSLAVWVPGNRGAMFARSPTLVAGERALLLLQPLDSLVTSLRIGYEYTPGQRYILRPIDKLPAALLPVLREIYR